MSDQFIKMTADIVSAYVTTNSVPAASLPELLASVYASMVSLGQPAAAPIPAEPLVPKVPIKKSITDEYLICLEDGKRFKSLKRHLTASYGMTAEQYRAKWGLPNSYPMVAPNYAAKRSQLAKSIGLGVKAAPAIRQVA